MEVHITIPDEVYRFYENASKFIANHTPEQIMADALTAYAGLLNSKAVQTSDAPANAAISRDSG